MTHVLSAIATWFNGFGHAMQSHIELRNGVPHLVTQNTDTGEPAAVHAIESDIVARLAQWQPEVGRIVGDFLGSQVATQTQPAPAAQPAAAAPQAPAAPAVVPPAPATSAMATPDASAAARPADVAAADRARRVAQLVAAGIDEATANRVVDVEGTGGTA